MIIVGIVWYWSQVTWQNWIIIDNDKINYENKLNKNMEIH